MPVQGSQLAGQIEAKIPNQTNFAGALNVSLDHVIFELEFTNPDDGLQDDHVNYKFENGGTAVHFPNESTVRIGVTGTVGSRVVMQTKRYLRYQPSKPIKPTFTGVIASNPQQRVRFGFFDDIRDKTVGVIDGNGYFMQWDRGTMSIVKRSFASGSQVDTVVNQADWNIDKLDGLGQSETTADWTKSQIYAMEIQWYGVGAVRIIMSINGIFYPIHQFNHANIIDTVHISRAVLPLRFEIETMEAGGSGGSAKVICMYVGSIGGYTPRGEIYVHDLGLGVTKSINTTESVLIALRAKPNSSRLTIRAEHVGVTNTANTNFEFSVYYGATVTGGTWTTQNAFTKVEKNTTATAFSGGYVIESDIVSSLVRDTTLEIRHPNYIASAINGTPDLIVITARSQSGNSSLSCKVTVNEI